MQPKQQPGPLNTHLPSDLTPDTMGVRNEFAGCHIINAPRQVFALKWAIYFSLHLSPQQRTQKTQQPTKENHPSCPIPPPARPTGEGCPLLAFVATGPSQGSGTVRSRKHTSSQELSGDRAKGRGQGRTCQRGRTKPRSPPLRAGQGNRRRGKQTPTPAPVRAPAWSLRHVLGTTSLCGKAAIAGMFKKDVKNWNRFTVTPLFISCLTFRHTASERSRRTCQQC